MYVANECAERIPFSPLLYSSSLVEERGRKGNWSLPCSLRRGYVD